MRYFYVTIIVLFVSFIVLPDNADALREPRPLTIDGRLKTMTYHPHQVYKFTGYFFFQTLIEFEIGENIQTISMGAPEGWSIQTGGNHMFIKPIALTKEEALTNMTVITNRRMYFFEMHADEVEDVKSQKIPFIISFLYPELDGGSGVIQVQGQQITSLDNRLVNYDYTLSGDVEIAPSQVFDDGLFTYFKFDQNKPVPAIFEVGRDGYEGLVNYRVQGRGDTEYIVVESIESQYTLRYGDTIACVFNERNPLRLIKEERKGFFSPISDD
ncbi:MAG: TrbG/VirB9 family P-type conjugative transfer protein [Rickettsiales bacterium]|nr:TrbG/VirB9 family P-type conjugative transfer protein [Rickettsiales bacterium]